MRLLVILMGCVPPLVMAAIAGAQERTEKRLDLHGDPLPNGALVRLGTVSGQRDDDVIWAVAWSPDGKTVASGSQDKTVRIWDAVTGKEIHLCKGHEHTATSLSWSPDGKTLASAGADKTIRLWDAATGKKVRACTGHDGFVLSVSWSPDGKTLASASADNTVRLWDGASGKELRACKEHEDWVHTVDWSPDAKTLASGGTDATVRLWDATGKQIRACEGHKSGITSVSWSPDARTLASSSYDDTIRLWDAATSKQIRVCRGHEHAVTSVAWAPDGKTLASASQDATLCFWDPATGTAIRSIALDGIWAHQVAFSADGRRLASANSNNTVLIWQVPSVPLAARQLSTDDLDRHWADLAGDDAARAERALWTLVAAQKQSVSFLQDRLPPAQRDPKLPERLKKLITELDSDEFQVRESASAELAKIGARAVEALEKALAGEPSAELKCRVDLLLEKQRWPIMPLQEWRALAVLERIGTDDARQVLETLAKGDADARLTREAMAALERLQRTKPARESESNQSSTSSH